MRILILQRGRATSMFFIFVFRLQHYLQWNVRLRFIILLSKQLYEPRTMCDHNNRPDQPHDYAGRQLLQHGTLLRLFRGMCHICLLSSIVYETLFHILSTNVRQFLHSHYLFQILFCVCCLLLLLR